MLNPPLLPLLLLLRLPLCVCAGGCCCSRAPTQALALIEGAGPWTHAAARALATWNGNFSAWAVGSPAFESQLHYKNNHGSWADAVLAASSLQGGNASLGIYTRVVSGASARRIATQIQPNGTMWVVHARTTPATHAAAVESRPPAPCHCCVCVQSQRVQIQG